MAGRKRDRRAEFVEAQPSIVDRIFNRDQGDGGGGLLRPFVLLWMVITAPLRILLHLVWLIFNGGRSVGDELRSRRWRHLIEGLPGVFATIGVLVAAAVILGREGELTGAYREAAYAAFSEEDYEAARLYFERLFELDNGSSETRYQLGVTLAKLGRDQEAMSLISGVANGDAGGDARANAWVAAHLMADEKLRNDPEVRAVIYSNLLEADVGLPLSLEVKMNLANFHLQAGHLRQAIPYLERAAVINPVLNLKLAKFYGAAGKKNSAEKALERADVYLQDQLDREPTNQKTRLLLAKTMAMRGRLPDAISLLKEGQILSPTAAYGKMIAELHVLMYDQLAAQSPPNYLAMLGHLRDALRLNPGMSGAIRRLVNFGERTTATGDESTAAANNSGANGGTKSPESEDGKSEAAAHAEEMLRMMLVRGENMAAAHMALGLKDYRDGDFETARVHFEAAYELEPTSVRIANNLAWILAHQGQPQLKRALAVINTVIERYPNEARFRDTRGEVYLAMGRWEEAKKDLEVALPRLKNDPRIHQSLAKAYAKLGIEELAQQHRDVAEKLHEAISAKKEPQEM